MPFFASLFQIANRTDLRTRSQFRNKLRRFLAGSGSVQTSTSDMCVLILKEQGKRKISCCQYEYFRVLCKYLNLHKLSYFLLAVVRQLVPYINESSS
jgi:hypothetical protein